MSFGYVHIPAQVIVKINAKGPAVGESVMCLSVTQPFSMTHTDKSGGMPLLLQHFCLTMYSVI